MFLATVIILGGAGHAHACDVGRLPTKHGKGEVRVRLASAECNGGEDAEAKDFYTGDALAVKILVPQGSELAGLDLKREDGLAATTAPAPRKLGDGSYFANLAFAAPGRWVIGIDLQRGKDTEKLALAVPVRLNPEQTAAAIANPTTVPDFRLTDLSGKVVTLKDLKGKVWVANLFFASCPEVCPLMARHLKDLQRTFKDQKDFRIVSVSTDPDSDTPEILKAFAKRHGADPATWLFLRGSKADVVALSDGGLKLDASATSPMHSMRFALIGKDGQVKARYDSTKLDDREQLKLAIKDLL